MEGKELRDEDTRERLHSFKSFFPTKNKGLVTPSSTCQSSKDARHVEANDPRKSSSVGSLFDSPQDHQKAITSGQESRSCTTEEEKHFQELESPQNVEESFDVEDVGFHMQLLHSPYKSHSRDVFHNGNSTSTRSSQESTSSTQGNMESTTNLTSKRTTSEDSPPNESEFYFCFKLNTLSSQEEEIFSHSKTEETKDSVPAFVNTGTNPLIPSLRSHPCLDSSAAKHRIALKKQKCRFAAESTADPSSDDIAVQHYHPRHRHQQLPQHHHHHLSTMLDSKQQTSRHRDNVKRLPQYHSLQTNRPISQQQCHHYQDRQRQRQTCYNVAEKENHSILTKKVETQVTRCQRERQLDAGISSRNSVNSTKMKALYVTETDIDSAMNTLGSSSLSRDHSLAANKQSIKSELDNNHRQSSHTFAQYNLPQFSQNDKLQNASQRQYSSHPESQRSSQDGRNISAQRHPSSHTTSDIQSIPICQPRYRHTYQSYTVPQPSNSNPNISLNQQHSDSHQFFEDDIWQKKPSGASLPQAKKKRSIPIGAKTNPLHAELMKEVSSAFKHNVAASSCSLDELEMSRNEGARSEFVNQPQSPFALIPPSKLVKGLTTKRSLTCVAKKPKSAGSNEESSSELAQMFDRFRRKKMQAEGKGSEGDSYLSDALLEPDSHSSNGETDFSTEKTTSQPILNSNDSRDSECCKTLVSEASRQSKHLSFAGEDTSDFDKNVTAILTSTVKVPTLQSNGRTNEGLTAKDKERSVKVQLEEPSSDEVKVHEIRGRNLSNCEKESKTLPRPITTRFVSNQQQQSYESRLKQPEKLIIKYFDQAESKDNDQVDQQKFQCTQDPRSCFNRSRSFSEESYIRGSLKVTEFSLDNDSKGEKTTQSFLRFPSAINSSSQPHQKMIFYRQLSHGNQFRPLTIPSNENKPNGVTYQPRNATAVQPSYVMPPAQSSVQSTQAIKQVQPKVQEASISYARQTSESSSSRRFAQKAPQQQNTSANITSTSSNQPSSSFFSQQLFPRTAPRRREFPQPVQQEPAWFALARRKSKEWSEKQIL